MTATLPPMIRFQPLVAGSPLPGGKVYFYTAGTLTPQAAYAADGTTPLVNPLTLDANGATDFRLGAGLSYKINLTDATGEPVLGWPVDQITDQYTLSIAYTDALRSDLASTESGKGAGLVGFLQSGTGAVSRTVEAKLRDAVSVKDFGAVGDGVTDDRIAIQAAFDSGAKKIAFPDGTYKCNSAITLPINSEIDFGAATLDFSGIGSSTTTAMSFSGTPLTELTALNATATVGSKSLVFASAPSVVAGDLILIYDGTDYSYSGFRTYYRAGEIVEVDSISSSTVTTKTSLFATYTLPNANLKCYKLTKCGLTLKGGKFLGAESYTSSVLKIERCTGLRIQGGEYYGGLANNIYLSNCYNAVVDGVTSVYSHAAGSSSYAMIVGNSQDVMVTNCDMTSTRHAFTTGGDDMVGAIPNRKILVKGNIFKTSSTSGGVGALDFHGNTEWSVMEGNEAEGISFGGNHNDVLNNQIRQASHLIYTGELSGLDIRIEGNRGRVTTASAVTTYGLFVDVGGGGTTYGGGSSPNGGQLVIKGNDFKAAALDAGVTSSEGIVFRVRGSAPADTRVLIEGNRLWQPGDVKSGGIHAVYIDSVTASSAATQIAMIEVCNNKVNGGALYLKDAQHVVVEGNRVSNCQSGSAIQVQCNNAIVEALNTNYELIVQNNEVYECGHTPIYLVGGTTTPSPWRTVIVRGNTCINGSQQTGGATATRAGIYVQQAATFIFQDNYLTSSSANQVRLVNWNTVTNLYEMNNFVGGSGTDSRASITNQKGFTYASGNYASATTPGSVARKIQVFDETGASIGYLAVYSSIT